MPTSFRLLQLLKVFSSLKYDHIQCISSMLMFIICLQLLKVEDIWIYITL